MTISKADVLTLEEVCENFLRISTQTGRNRLSQGLSMPPSFRIGRRRLFLASEVAIWINQTAGIADEFDSSEPLSHRRRGRPREKHHRLA